MKTLEPRNPGKFTLNSLRGLLPALLAGGLLWIGPAAAQGGNAGTNLAPAHVSQNQIANTNQPALSPAVLEVVKLADAGVSAEVIRSYIETSPAWKPTDDDVIEMKKHKVGDEIVTLLLKRGAAARTAATQARNEAVNRVIVSRQESAGGFDPESYDYFRYHYLQPRAVASVQQRLTPNYYHPYVVRPYGYGPGYGFGPSFGGRPFYPGAGYRWRY